MPRFFFILAIFTALFVDANSQTRFKIANDKEIWVCPATYMVDKSVIQLGYVKTGIPKKKDKADFDTKMREMANEAYAMGGQLMVLHNFRDARQSGNYAMRFNVFKANESGKIAVNNTTSEKDASQSTIVLYRPVYSGSYNDSVSFDVIINDTLRLPLNGNMKYLLRCAAGSSVKLTVSGQGIVEQVAVGAGKKYYFRGFVNIPGSNRMITNGGVSRIIKGYAAYIEPISELQGELESSLLNSYILWKKI